MSEIASSPGSELAKHLLELCVLTVQLICLRDIMEFPFDINKLFSERVSILDQTLIAGRTSAGR